MHLCSSCGEEGIDGKALVNLPHAGGPQMRDKQLPQKPQRRGGGQWRVVKKGRQLKVIHGSIRRAVRDGDDEETHDEDFFFWERKSSIDTCLIAVRYFQISTDQNLSSHGHRHPRNPNLVVTTSGCRSIWERTPRNYGSLPLVFPLQTLVFFFLPYDTTHVFINSLPHLEGAHHVGNYILIR